MGDTVNGPGIKTLVTDLICKLFYNDIKNNKKISLSNLLRLIHKKESKVSYHNNHPVDIQEKLLFIGMDTKTLLERVIFDIPISHLKPLIDLIKNLSNKPA